MAPRRAKRKQEIAADARRNADRDRIVNWLWAGLRWTLLRILEGGLPEAGKVLFRIGAGGLAALVARWLYGE